MVEIALSELRDLMVKGGFVMPPLAIGCLILWYAIGARAFTLRRGTKLPLRNLLSQAKAGELQAKGIMDWAVLEGVKRTEQASSQGLPQVLDEHIAALNLELGHQSAIIRAIVFAAPLTGLLGTVAGMIEVFDSLGSMSLFSQSGGIAGGVAQALLTTQMGLAVAIPGTIIGRLLNSKQRSLEGELDELRELLLLEASQL